MANSKLCPFPLVSTRMLTLGMLGGNKQLMDTGLSLLGASKVTDGVRSRIGACFPPQAGWDNGQIKTALARGRQSQPIRIPATCHLPPAFRLHRPRAARNEVPTGFRPVLGVEYHGTNDQMPAVVSWPPSCLKLTVAIDDQREYLRSNPRVQPNPCTIKSLCNRITDSSSVCSLCSQGSFSQVHYSYLPWGEQMANYPIIGAPNPTRRDHLRACVNTRPFIFYSEKNVCPDYLSTY